MSPSPNAVVAIYCRITIDKSGRREGVEVQERYGRAYAAQHWPGMPVEVFADNHITAADPKVVRPEFERLRRWLRDGMVAHIWCIEQYRFVRQELEWFTVAIELDDAGIHEIHTRNDGIVRVDDDVAGLKAVLGAGEVRRVKRRVNNRVRDDAMRGLPPAAVPFAYRHVHPPGKPRTYEIIPERAEALRWAADMVLNSGWGLARVLTEFKARGFTGVRRRKIVDPISGEPVIDIATGEPMTEDTALTAATIRKALLSPTNAGLRIYRGEVVGKGNWDPIFSEETHHRLRAHFGAPRLLQGSDGRIYPMDPDRHTGRSVRRYLLSAGLAVCAVCSAPLTAAQRKTRKGDVIPYYTCHPNRGGKGCVGIQGQPLEDRVVELLFEEISKPGRLDAFLRDDYAERRKELSDELGAIDVRRAELAEMWGAREVTTEEWKAMRAGLEQDEARARAELASTPPPPEGFDAEALKDPRAWSLMEIQEQRAFLRLFVKQVVIKRAAPPYQRFDTTRIKIVWA
jgi:hypothetical protein